MKLMVIDVETTGNEDTDQVIEIAVVSIYDNVQLTWHSLVRPTVPINVVARATHHILDADLLEAPMVAELNLPWGLSPEEVVLVGHCIAFDVRMLRQSGIENLPTRTICTMRCAKHLYPEAPRFSNQVLRYHLGLNAPPASLFPPHRALSDAVVTAALLKHMLQYATVDELVAMTQAPALLSNVTVGVRHRGKPWSNVDEGYLRWVLGCNDPPFDDDVRHTVRHWLNVKEEARAEQKRLLAEKRKQDADQANI